MSRIKTIEEFLEENLQGYGHVSEYPVDTVEDMMKSFGEHVREETLKEAALIPGKHPFNCKKIKQLNDSEALEIK